MQEASEVRKEYSKESKLVLYSKLRMDAVLSRNLSWKVTINRARMQYTYVNFIEKFQTSFHWPLIIASFRLLSSVYYHQSFFISMRTFVKTNYISQHAFRSNLHI